MRLLYRNKTLSNISCLLLSFFNLKKLYRDTLFRYTIYKVWDAGLGVMFRAFRMRGGGFSWG